MSSFPPPQRARAKVISFFPSQQFISCYPLEAFRFGKKNFTLIYGYLCAQLGATNIFPPVPTPGNRISSSQIPLIPLIEGFQLFLTVEALSLYRSFRMDLTDILSPMKYCTNPVLHRYLFIVSRDKSCLSAKIIYY